MSEDKRQDPGCSSCGDVQKREEEQRKALLQRMERVKKTILVLSGKGGVGKSTVAVNLAVSLALMEKNVGLLDIDIHGPSIPKLLHMEDQDLVSDGESILPVDYGPNMKVMSLGFATQGRDEAIIWRGPMKHGVIRQFLADVAWGELDYLVVDSPPGTGDEPLSVAQLMANQAQAVIVTTPQEIALADVRKSIAFCRRLNLPILGVVENMSGFICPHCGEPADVFKSGGGEEMARTLEVPFLGRVPLDPEVVVACDAGEPYVDKYATSGTAKAFTKIIESILQGTAQ